nr:DUF1003 domain-containing protein [uncultured bacterium]
MSGSEWAGSRLRRRHPQVAKVIERNVAAISENRKAAERSRSFQHHLADFVTRFAGSMTFVYLHVIWFGTWVTINLAVVRFDPNFAALTMIVSLEAIFLSVFILVSQNRQAALTEQHAELDLQMTLLDEYETTRILTLVKALAEKAGIADAGDPELEELKQDVEPQRVLAEIEKRRPDALPK